MLLDSYFIIRGKTHTFKKQQNKMKKEGKTDETHEINIKKAQINNFFTEEVKKFARKTREIKVRIVFVKLKTGETETLFNQFTQRNSNTRRIKRIIWNKMDNRKKLRQI